MFPMLALSFQVGGVAAYKLSSPMGWNNKRNFLIYSYPFSGGNLFWIFLYEILSVWKGGQNFWQHFYYNPHLHFIHFQLSLPSVFSLVHKMPTLNSSVTLKFLDFWMTWLASNQNLEKDCRETIWLVLKFLETSIFLKWCNFNQLK